MRAIDANVLVRLITRDDLRQAKSADRFSAARLATALQMLLNHKDLTLQDPDAVAAALDLFRSRPALGFSDCLMLQLARKAGHVPLGTFDRALAKTAGTQKL
jgi:predicted nucleic-acid-binding protein